MSASPYQILDAKKSHLPQIERRNLDGGCDNASKHELNIACQDCGYTQDRERYKGPQWTPFSHLDLDDKEAIKSALAVYLICVQYGPHCAAVFAHSVKRPHPVEMASGLRLYHRTIDQRVEGPQARRCDALIQAYTRYIENPTSIGDWDLLNLALRANATDDDLAVAEAYSASLDTETHRNKFPISTVNAVLRGEINKANLAIFEGIEDTAPSTPTSGSETKGSSGFNLDTKSQNNSSTSSDPSKGAGNHTKTGSGTGNSTLPGSTGTATQQTAPGTETSNISLVSTALTTPFKSPHNDTGILLSSNIKIRFYSSELRNFQNNHANSSNKTESTSSIQPLNAQPLSSNASNPYGSGLKIKFFSSELRSTTKRKQDTENTNVIISKRTKTETGSVSSSTLARGIIEEGNYVIFNGVRMSKWKALQLHHDANNVPLVLAAVSVRLEQELTRARLKRCELLPTVLMYSPVQSPDSSPCATPCPKRITRSSMKKTAPPIETKLVDRLIEKKLQVQRSVLAQKGKDVLTKKTGGILKKARKKKQAHIAQSITAQQLDMNNHGSE